ncbi:MAG TPA: GTP-binding protein [Candidatus Binatia bacterium]|nr:GTP-binding protein [Candidatus Binatia bacterium]
MKRVAVDIVTGFLGSGKTTLLRNLLEAAPSRERIAVIVNEVGEIGIDGRVLTGFEHIESVVELAGGCICCSIDEYRFDFAIHELIAAVDPTLLLIETTGVADPGPAIERVARAGLGLDAVVTVVDAAAWARAWRLSSVVRRQIESADFLVLSKTDLVQRRRLQSLRRRLAKVNSRAHVLESAHGKLGGDASLLTAAGLRAAWLTQTPSGQSADEEPARAARTHTVPSADEPGQTSVSPSVTAREEDVAAGRAETPGDQGDHFAAADLESFSYLSVRPVDRGAFEAFLAALPPQVYRAKGFIRLAGGGQTWLFNHVCGRSELSLFEMGAIDAGLQAVFIGRGIARHRPHILAELERCCRELRPAPVSS